MQPVSVSTKMHVFVLWSGENATARTNKAVFVLASDENDRARTNLPDFVLGPAARTE